MLPVMMSAQEQSTLRDFLRCAGSYLEFGAGGSTTVAAVLVRDRVETVESSQSWIDRVAADLGREGRAGKVRLHRADIGPVGDVGFPADESHRALWPRYHQEVWNSVAGSDIDLFLVDGRFRLACIAQILLRCRSDAIVLMHDYCHRPQYHAAAELATEICRTGALSAFIRRRDFDPRQAQALLASNEYSPA